MKYISIITLLLAINIATANEQCSGLILDLKNISPGSLKNIKLKDKHSASLLIYHRTEFDIKVLNKQKEYLKKSAPEKLQLNNNIHSSWPSFMPRSESRWASSDLRSFSQKYFVAWSDTPFLKCPLIHKPRKDSKDTNIKKFQVDRWPGGFFNPCYGVGYNYAGRVILSAEFINNSELQELSKYNLVVPEYSISNNTLCLK